MDLNGKRILIAGASSGIGREILLSLIADFDCKVAAAARSLDSLSDIISDKVYLLPYDAGEKNSIDAMIDEAINIMGGIDCVVACTGFGYFEQFIERDFEHISRIYEVNVISHLYTLQKLLSKTEGKISFTLISSALGKMGLAGYSLYCSTKFAIDGFSRAYRYEVPHRLHYMTVYPIGVKHTRFYKKISDNMPLPRPLQDVRKVARSVINGIIKEKRSVYPSVAFHMAYGLNRVLPFLFTIYQNWYKRRYYKWLKENHSADIEEIRH